jgi:hypothetical protein
VIQKNLNLWAEFEAEIISLNVRVKELKSARPMHVSDLLFRGQHKAAWGLTTTLERYSKKHLEASEYYRRILAAKPQIEAHTGREWEVPGISEYIKYLSEEKLFGMRGMPGYDYFVHLRHFGFPSPLLDWSRSPYVAAFFAFSNCDPTIDDRVAVYAYLEYAGQGKCGVSGETRIFAHGPHVRSHQRHFLQQSEYTVCTKREHNKWIYAPHESAIASQKFDEDIFWKYTIPSSEKYKVLQSLDRHNLNAFSLFGTEESLMQTVALRELIFRGEDFS